MAKQRAYNPDRYQRPDIIMSLSFKDVAALTFLGGYNQGWHRRIPDDLLGH